MPADDIAGFEYRVLAEIARGNRGIRTPADVARALGATLQQVTHTVRFLEKMRLVRVRRLPRQVSYEISPQGQECLNAIRSCTRCDSGKLTERQAHEQSASVHRDHR